METRCAGNCEYQTTPPHFNAPPLLCAHYHYYHHKIITTIWYRNHSQKKKKKYVEYTSRETVKSFLSATLETLSQILKIYWRRVKYILERENLGRVGRET